MADVEDVDEVEELLAVSLLLSLLDEPDEPDAANCEVLMNIWNSGGGPGGGPDGGPPWTVSDASSDDAPRLRWVAVLDVVASLPFTFNRWLMRCAALQPPPVDDTLFIMGLSLR